MEKIAAWKSDLIRVLHIFNVGPIVCARPSLTRHLQTELAINTHVTVSDTHAIVSKLEHNVTTMVSDIHRAVVKGQEGNDGQTLSVSNTLSITELILIAT